MPVSISILSVLGLLLGMLGLITNPLAILSVLAGPGEETVRIMGQEFPVPQYHGVHFALHVLLKMIGFLLAVTLIIGAAGSLGRKPWARNLMRLWAVVYLLKVLGEQVVDTIVMAPLLAEALPAGEMSEGAESVVMAFSAIFALLCGLICWGIYPVAVLFVFSTRTAEAAFEEGTGPGGWPPGGGGYPGAGPGPSSQPHWTPEGGWQQPSAPPHQYGPPPPPAQGYGPPQPPAPPRDAYPPPPPIEAGPGAFDTDEERERGDRR